MPGERGGVQPPPGDREISAGQPVPAELHRQLAVRVDVVGGDDDDSVRPQRANPKRAIAISTVPAEQRVPPGRRLRHRWPIVTGQCRASAIVTGRAGCLAGPAGAPVRAPWAGLAVGAGLVAVLAGPPVQPRRATLMPAARAVATISLRGIGGAPSVVPYCYTATRRQFRARGGRCQCAELAMASAAVLPRLPSRRSATCLVPQIRVLPVVSRAEAMAGVPSRVMYTNP